MATSPDPADTAETKSEILDTELPPPLLDSPQVAAAAPRNPHSERNAKRRKQREERIKALKRERKGRINRAT